MGGICIGVESVCLPSSHAPGKVRSYEPLRGTCMNWPRDGIKIINNTTTSQPRCRCFYTAPLRSSLRKAACGRMVTALLGGTGLHVCTTWQQSVQGRS